MKYLSNIFRLENLHEITSEYRLLKIKGLRKNKDYQINKQYLIDKLSKILRHPVTIIDTNNEPKIVVKNDEIVLNKLEAMQDFGRLTLRFERAEDIFELDFVNPNDDVKTICLRFLQFDITSELKKNPNLWQPKTGDPFFLKVAEESEGISIYNGFSFRVLEIPLGGFGIAIDASRKFVSSKHLDYYINKQFFNKFIKKKTFVYKYKDWYEIQPVEVNDFNVSEFIIDNVSLIDFIRNSIPKPHSPILANLPKDGAVLDYYTSGFETRGVPSGLCFEVLDFQDTHNSEINKKSIISPEKRFYEIYNYKKEYFDQIKFDRKSLKVAEKRIESKKTIFPFPDFELGNNFVLSKSDFGNNEFNLPKKITKRRMNYLMKSDIGFYTKSPLPDQFVVLPRSINDSKGELFIQMLTETVNQMYSADKYNPQIISFENKFKQGTDYCEIGKHIVDAIVLKYQKSKPAYGVIMIPRIEKKAKREHDKLAALIIKELKLLNFHCSIIHTETINQCFEEKTNKEGKTFFGVKPDKQNKLNGYLKNIAINKVLLNCNKWPFILKEPLSADITIGIDVKHNTAGFTIIDKKCKNIRTELDETSNKEKLSSEQLKAWLYKIISTEYKLDPNANIKNIVIHRDGRLFDSELEGLNSGLQKLVDDMIINHDTTLNIIEIPKSSFLPLRLFGVNFNEQSKKNFIENPPTGLCFCNNHDAFLCSTGKEFSHEGTSNPLHIKYSYGTMKFEDILSDLFKLTTLAFTKPDDCSRYPLTIKINDIKLSESASEYDEDAYKNIKILLENSKITNI